MEPTANAVPGWLIDPAKASAAAVTNGAKVINESSKLVLTGVIKIRSLVPITKGDIKVIKQQDELLNALTC